MDGLKEGLQEAFKLSEGTGKASFDGQGLPNNYLSLSVEYSNAQGPKFRMLHVSY